MRQTSAAARLMPIETRILADIALLLFIFAIVAYTCWGPSGRG